MLVDLYRKRTDNFVTQNQYLRVLFLVRSGLVQRTKGTWELTKLGVAYAEGILGLDVQLPETPKEEKE